MSAHSNWLALACPGMQRSAARGAASWKTLCKGDGRWAGNGPVSATSQGGFTQGSAQLGPRPHPCPQPAQPGSPLVTKKRRPDESGRLSKTEENRGEGSPSMANHGFSGRCGCGAASIAPRTLATCEAVTAEAWLPQFERTKVSTSATSRSVRRSAKPGIP